MDEIALEGIEECLRRAKGLRPSALPFGFALTLAANRALCSYGIPKGGTPFGGRVQRGQRPLWPPEAFPYGLAPNKYCLGVAPM